MGADSTRAPVGATAFTTNDDADILAAWERFSANRLAIFDLSDEAPDYDKQDACLWNAIDDDEAFIGKAIANTPAGAEVQLWCILSHEAGADSEPYALRRDLAHFDDHGAALDWSPKLALQAIRSLRAMSARQSASDGRRFAAAWAAYRDAFNAANAFYLLNFPGDDGDLTDFEPAFDAYVSVAFDAAVAVMLAPASSAADMASKLIVIDQHDVSGWGGLTQGPILHQLAADALALAGGAA